MSPTFRVLSGTVAAIAGALAGAIVWAVITSSTGWQIGYMALGVGLLAGYGMRLAGAGERSGGIIAALVALAGCVVGNWLTVAIEASKEYHQPLTTVLLGLAANPAFSMKLLQIGFTPMDLVFYAIAAYAGYRTAIRPHPAAIVAPPPEPAQP